MLKVGLTGGIASGKTTVAGFFSELSVPVILIDEINGYLLDNDEEVFWQIAEHFSDVVIANKLDRKKIAKIIFTDENEKKWLESLMHPKIKKIIDDQLSKITTNYCIIEIPILFESNFWDLVDTVLVIDIPDDVKIKRAIVRDSKTEQDINDIIRNQVSREYRIKHADDIIDGSKSLIEVKKQVLELHNKYM